MSDRPPASGLLRTLSWLVPGRFREEFYGDLVEEARARHHAGHGPGQVRAWVLVQLLRSIPLLNLNALERTMDKLDRPIRGGGAILFGLIHGLLIVGLLDLAPQPAGTLILCALIAVMLFTVGVVTLRRTNFVFMGTGMLLGAVGLVALAILVVSGTVSAPPTEPWVLIWFAIGLGLWLALMWLEKRRAPEEYATWKRVVDEAGYVDILFLRHIPHMR